jgi:hypothetical protein
VLRFLSDTTIPPTSNQAERDLRPAKTQQKISGRLRSEECTRDRYAIRGYASTAAKNGHQIFTAIRDALAGNPWIPPAPATCVAGAGSEVRIGGVVHVTTVLPPDTTVPIGWIAAAHPGDRVIDTDTPRQD